MEASGQPTTLATAEALLSRYPTAALLRQYAASILSAREVELLPSSAVDADVFALRLAEVLSALGLATVEGTSSQAIRTQAPSFTSRFLTTHQAFFDAVCEAMADTRTARVTIMGPTFLLPDYVLDRRDREKPGRNFTRELKQKLVLPIDFAHIVLRNSSERFASMISAYVESADEFRAVIGQMLDAQDEMSATGLYPTLRYRCVDTGYMHIPHIFDSVALLGSRRSPNAPVDGGWVVQDPLSVDMEKTRFDRIFEGSEQTRAQAAHRLREFLEGLL